MSRSSPLFTTLTNPDMQLSTLPSSRVMARLLQIAGGDTGDFSSESGELSVVGKKSSLVSHFIQNYITAEALSMPNFGIATTSSRLIALELFLQHFILAINSNTEYDIYKSVESYKSIEWIFDNVDLSLISSIFSLETIAVKTFLKKIFPVVVKFGNTKVAKTIIYHNIDIVSHKHKDLQNHCMSIAVKNKDNRMVELLCLAGFPAQLTQYPKCLPWRTGSVEILRTLLEFCSDPNFLVRDECPGFSLADAANSGNLDAVKILLEANCEINVHVPSTFGTPLQAAISGEHIEIAEFLIKRGAKINAPSGMHIPRAASLCGWGPKFLPLKTPIEIACYKNNTQLVQMLLTHGGLAQFSPFPQFSVDIEALVRLEKERLDYPHYDNARYEAVYAYSALQYGVRNGSIDIVRLLFMHGVDPNSRMNDWCDTPLQISARLGYSEIAQALIDYGADINAPPATYSGRTAIQAAAEAGNLPLVKMLLSRNANMHASAAPERGLTAIQAAAKSGNLNLIKYLLQNGADVNSPISRYRGMTAIGAITSHKNMSMLKFFIKQGSDIHQSEHERISPLVVAVRNGWIAGAQYLLQNGANVNASDRFLGPLGWSIHDDNTEMMSLLLENGGNLFSNIDGCTDALCFALFQGCCYESILRILAEYKTLGPNCVNPNVLAAATKSTFFHENTLVLEVMLNFISTFPKALREAQMRNTWSQITLAYDSGSDQNLVIDVISILVKAGAEINRKFDFGYSGGDGSLLQFTIRQNLVDVSRYLVKNGAETRVPANENTGTPLQEAIQCCDEIEFAYFLLEHGSDINAPAALDKGRTALQAAVVHEHKDLVKDLLDRGADVNAPPAHKRGVTALQAAAINDDIDIAILLLQHGAHVAAAAAECQGRTAINGAAERGHLDMLQLLLNHYDVFEDINNVLQQAAVYAEGERHFEVAQWLRNYPNV